VAVKNEISDILDQLSEIGTQDDAQITLGTTCLLMISVFHPSIERTSYHAHLDLLTSTTKNNFDALIADGETDNNETRLNALKKTFLEDQEYSGDLDRTYDVRNADLIQVIDRRKGLPTTIGLLYIHVARALGWDIDALSFPANFILRLSCDAEFLIFDPFNDSQILDAPDLRKLLKTAHGDHAELSSSFYMPLTNKEILINIFNFIKLKFIEAEDYKNAALAVEAMMALDHNEYRLFLDAGILFSKIGRPEEAISHLENYIDQAPGSNDRQEAALLIQQIRQSMSAP
jgi:regulator of sirC expression with transglutaminase-like and TPR domain